MDECTAVMLATSCKTLRAKLIAPNTELGATIKANSKNICVIASKYGFVNLLKWTYSQGARMVDERILIELAALGNIEDVKWALSKGLKTQPWKIAREASKHSHFELAKWVCLQEAYVFLHGICPPAVQYSNIEVLEWTIRMSNNPQGVLDLVIPEAAERGLIIVLEWGERELMKYDLPSVELWKQAANYAAISGRTVVLNWLLNRCALSVLNPISICNAAISNKKLDILIWLKAQGSLQLNEESMRLAAINGDLGIVRFCHENDVSWPNHICQIAAEYGHLHIIRYAIVNGAPWRSEEEGQPLWKASFAVNAAKHGHLPILKWVRDEYGSISDGPWNINIYAIKPICKDDQERLLDWCYENGDIFKPEVNQLILKKSLKRSWIHVLEWLKRHNCFYWHDEYWISASISLDVLKWLVDKGGVSLSAAAFQNIINHAESADVIMWAKNSHKCG